jgi:maltose O-acetyltransferase
MGANGHRPHAGAGSAVFEAARDWALDHGAARLVIIGNTGLAAARHIYEKYGFRGTPAEDCGYRRGDIAYIYDTAAPMREADKLDAGLPYCYDDPEVDGRKQRAIAACRDYNAIDPADFAGQTAQLARMLGHAGEKVWIGKAFNCDNGRNIHIGRNFTGNYNLTILDIREVRIGDNVMIGPNTLITTVNHPMTPMGRRVHIGIAKPVFIGDDVWIGGNVTILPGVHIGSNVVVAAGAVVTRDVPDNTLVGGVPAKKIRTLVSDVPPAEACRPAEGTVADDD